MFRRIVEIAQADIDICRSDVRQVLDAIMTEAQLYQRQCRGTSEIDG